MLSAFWPVWLARAAWNSEGGKGVRRLVWNLPKVKSGRDPERGGQSSPAGRAHQFRVHLEQKVEEKQQLKGFPSLQTSAPAIRPSRHPEPEYGRLCQERSHEGRAEMTVQTYSQSTPKAPPPVSSSKLSRVSPVRILVGEMTAQFPEELYTL